MNTPPEETAPVTLSAEDLQDVAFYMQSLLQIMAADDHLHPEEQARVRGYAVTHGYSASFINEAIESVLTNKYMPKTPPRFHSRDTAQRFLRDAVEIARCDGVLHPREEEWLRDAARRNDINPDELL